MNEANSDGNFVYLYCNTVYHQNYEVIIIDLMDYQRTLNYNSDDDELGVTFRMFDKVSELECSNRSVRS